MHRLLRQLDHLDASQGRRTRHRGDVGRQLVAGIVAIGLAVMGGLLFAKQQFGIPVSMEGIQRTMLGNPPEVAIGVGSFRFLMTQPSDPSRPVAYDPCRPIDYVVNDRLAPGLAQGVIDDAISEIEAATSLDFRYVGTSSRLPTSDGSPATADREPVIIGWTTPDALPDLKGRVAGVGGSSARGDDFTRELQYVTGLVALDAPQLEDVLTRPHGEAQVRAIVTHELAHLVGLGHVEDSNELMHSDNVGKLDLGPGDREGLAALGSGRCS